MSTRHGLEIDRRRLLLGAAAFACGTHASLAAPPPAGALPDLGERLILPPDNPWNRDISRLPVDPQSDILVRRIGLDRPLHPDFGPGQGIPYCVVPKDQRRVPVRFSYALESDPGPYPIPDDAPIEGGPSSRGDRHVLVVDRDRWIVYELFDAHREARGWRAGSGAIFDLNSNKLRPAGLTSADAAGLPILPGLARYEEAVGRGVIRHALRFTCRVTRRAYVHPARHFASRSGDPTLPPMGMRVRLKASVDVMKYAPMTRPILVALQTYGMILADNGSDWFVSGAPDPRWDNEELATMKRIKGRDFEVVKMGPLQVG